MDDSKDFDINARQMSGFIVYYGSQGEDALRPFSVSAYSMVDALARFSKSLPDSTPIYIKSQWARGPLYPVKRKVTYDVVS